MTTSRDEWLAEVSESLGLASDDVLAIAAMFFQAIDSRLQAVQRAYRAGDMKELCRLAHGIKGDAANMRFHASSQLARVLEVQGRAGQIEDFDGQFAALCDAIRAQRRALGLDA